MERPRVKHLLVCVGEGSLRLHVMRIFFLFIFWLFLYVISIVGIRDKDSEVKHFYMGNQGFIRINL